jgi:hypothetical protein
MKKLIKLIRQILPFWIPLGVGVTLICGLIYATVQQDYRQSANDPQVQIAEDVVYAIEGGRKADTIVSPTAPKVDMEKNLDAYVIVYNDKGEVLNSSAQLENKAPQLPSGVLDFVRKNGEERLTWEPKKDVRHAVVVKRYKDGFVLAGRSLREVEKREQKLTLQIAAGWLATMGATLFLSLVLTPKRLLK